MTNSSVDYLFCKVGGRQRRPTYADPLHPSLAHPPSTNKYPCETKRVSTTPRPRKKTCKPTNQPPKLWYSFVAHDPLSIPRPYTPSSERVTHTITSRTTNQESEGVPPVKTRE